MCAFLLSCTNALTFTCKSLLLQTHLFQNQNETKKSKPYSGIVDMNNKIPLVFTLFGCAIILELLLSSLYASKTKSGQSEEGNKSVKNYDIIFIQRVKHYNIQMFAIKFSNQHNRY